MRKRALRIKAVACKAMSGGRGRGRLLLLTFAISWGVWVPVALDGDFRESVERSPLLLLPALAPGIAAILLSLLGGGRAGLRRLLSKLGTWRAGLRWYLVALLLPLALGVTARGLEGLVQGDWETLTDPGLIGLILVGLVPALFIALGRQHWDRRWRCSCSSRGF